MKTTPALLAPLALAAGAAAQAPEVSFSLFASRGAVSTPLALPPGESFQSLGKFGPGRAILSSTTHHVFISDGLTLTPVLQDGVQIAGQPDGVVWRSGDLASGAAFDVPGGVLFHAFASGPGLGDAPQTVAVIGGAATADPLWLSPVPSDHMLSRVTRTGLALRDVPCPQLEAGPVDGSSAVYFTDGASLPGFSSPVSAWIAARLSAGGLLSATARIGAPTVYALALLAPGSARVLCTSDSALPTDRGQLRPSGTLQSTLQPAADGSVFLVTPAAFPDGASRGVILQVRDGDPASVLAVVGERAPGTPDGFTLRSFNALCSTAGGRLLWLAQLNDASGAAAGQALYLTSNGRTRLIIRTRTPAPGNPAGQLVNDFPTPAAASIFQLDDLGNVAFIPTPGAAPLIDAALYLYNPEAGTVEAARRDRPLPPELGVPGPVRSINVVVGGFSTPLSSGADDTGLRLLDPDGSMFVFLTVGTSSVNTGLALSARITSPGCRPDYNADGFLDFFDYDAFLECFEGGACPNGKDADFNNDDFADFFDLIDYVDAFEAGC